VTSLPTSLIGSRPPKKIIAADAYAWRVAQGVWPPATWGLEYDFVSAGDRVNVVAVDEGAGTWLVDLDAAATASLTPSIDYEVFEYVTDGTDSRTLRRWRIPVLPDPRSASSGADYRSQARSMLEAIQALLAGKALKGDQLAYSIAGRQLTRYTPEELVKWEKVYIHRVRVEDRQAAIERGESPGNIIQIRFGAAA